MKRVLFLIRTLLIAVLLSAIYIIFEDTRFLISVGAVVALSLLLAWVFMPSRDRDNL